MPRFRFGSKQSFRQMHVAPVEIYDLDKVPAGWFAVLDWEAPVTQVLQATSDLQEARVGLQVHGRPGVVLACKERNGLFRVVSPVRAAAAVAEVA